MFTAGDCEPGVVTSFSKKLQLWLYWGGGGKEDKQAPANSLTPGGGQMLLLRGQTYVLRCEISEQRRFLLAKGTQRRTQGRGCQKTTVQWSGLEAELLLGPPLWKWIFVLQRKLRGFLP